MTSAASVTIIENELTYRIHRDATYLLDVHQTVRAETEGAIAQISQMPLVFSESLQDIEILEAYTTTREGRRIGVPKDKIFVQQLPVSASAPVFSDHKMKVVVFPQVEVGGTVTVHFLLTQKKPELPGVFSMRQVFRITDAFETSTVRIIAPSDMSLTVRSQGLSGGEVASSRSDQKEWRLSLPKAPAVTPEDGSVDVADLSPYIEVSNLHSYDELAQTYASAATVSAKVTSRIQELADTITQNVSGERAQAEALYRWVSRNIRYVAIAIDQGGYIPHAAEAVLDSRYGDCKDHVALLEALLAAKKIRSSPALVSASGSYVLPDTAVLSAFNHVITYLPDLSLLVDSTPPFAPFGVLGDNIAGKKVLVIDRGNGAPGVITAPLVGGSENAIRVDTEVTVDRGGSVTGTSHVKARGIYEFIHRSVLDGFPRDQLPQIAASLLGSLGQYGTGNLRFGDPRELAAPFDYDSEFHVPASANTAKEGTLGTGFGIGSPVGIAGFLKLASLPQRSLPFPCIGGSREEITRLHLPETWSVKQLPIPALYDSGFGRYESTYRREGATIVVSRRLTLQFPRATCDSKEYAEVRSMADVVARDLRAQLFYGTD